MENINKIDMLWSDFKKKQNFYLSPKKSKITNEEFEELKKQNLEIVRMLNPENYEKAKQEFSQLKPTEIESIEESSQEDKKEDINTTLKLITKKELFTESENKIINSLNEEKQTEAILSVEKEIGFTTDDQYEIIKSFLFLIHKDNGLPKLNTYLGSLFKLILNEEDISALGGLKSKLMPLFSSNRFIYAITNLILFLIFMFLRPTNIAIKEQDSTFYFVINSKDNKEVLINVGKNKEQAEKLKNDIENIIKQNKINNNVLQNIYKNYLSLHKLISGTIKYSNVNFPKLNQLFNLTGSRLDFIDFMSVISNLEAVTPSTKEDEDFENELNKNEDLTSDEMTEFKKNAYIERLIRSLVRYPKYATLSLVILFISFMGSLKTNSVFKSALIKIINTNKNIFSSMIVIQDSIEVIKKSSIEESMNETENFFSLLYSYHMLNLNDIMNKNENKEINDGKIEIYPYEIKQLSEDTFNIFSEYLYSITINCSESISKKLSVFNFLFLQKNFNISIKILQDLSESLFVKDECYKKIFTGYYSRLSLLSDKLNNNIIYTINGKDINFYVASIISIILCINNIKYFDQYNYWSLSYEYAFNNTVINIRKDKSYILLNIINYIYYFKSYINNITNVYAKQFENIAEGNENEIMCIIKEVITNKNSQWLNCQDVSKKYLYLNFYFNFLYYLRDLRSANLENEVIVPDLNKYLNECVTEMANLNNIESNTTDPVLNNFYKELDKVFHYVFGVNMNNKLNPLYVFSILDLLYFKLNFCKKNIQSSMFNYMNDKLNISGKIGIKTSKEDESKLDSFLGGNSVDSISEEIQSVTSNFFDEDSNEVEVNDKEETDKEETDEKETVINESNTSEETTEEEVNEEEKKEEVEENENKENPIPQEDEPTKKSFNEVTDIIAKIYDL